jgi:hypothetical protein
MALLVYQVFRDHPVSQGLKVLLVSVIQVLQDLQVLKVFRDLPV